MTHKKVWISEEKGSCHLYRVQEFSNEFRFRVMEDLYLGEHNYSGTIIYAVFRSQEDAELFIKSLPSSTDGHQS